MTFMQVAIAVASLCAVISAGCAVVRLFRGPSHADRIVALDAVSHFAVALVGVIALQSGHAVYLDVAVALALVAFIGTIAFARYLEHCSDPDAPSDSPSDGSGPPAGQDMPSVASNIENEV